MDRIMTLLAKETKGKSYNTEKFSYDTKGLPSVEYDDDSEKLVKWEGSAETERHKHYVDLSNEVEKYANSESMLVYFLDGSRHVYKVDDISYDGKVYPVIAGQIGVGCCKRENRVVKAQPELFRRKLVIALPRKANYASWSHEAFFRDRVNSINKMPRIRALNIEFDKILAYNEPADKRKGKVEDNGIAVVQDYMMQTEIDLVADLAKKNKLDEDHYLLKDGSLEYPVSMRDTPETYDIRKLKNNYRYVIGVSKSFNPEALRDYNNKPNANYIVDLPVGCRTPVARYQSNASSGMRFAVWYIRLRDKSQTRTPLDGVIKVEKILMEDELDTGLDSAEVDRISASLFMDRNPTCYGTDRRWANHLYPVYLTEKYIKSKYMSTESFLSLF